LKHDATLKIAERLAAGDTCRNIAKDCNTSPATVSRRANDPAIKQLIDKIREEHYQDNLQRAKDNFTHFIKNCTTTDNNNIRYLGFKASELTLQSAGVLTSPNPSVYVQNIYNDHSTTIISPVIKELLQNQAKQMEAVAVEYEIVDSNDSSLDNAVHGSESMPDDIQSPCSDVQASCTHSNNLTNSGNGEANQ